MYILENRKRKGKGLCPNKTVTIVGVFTSVELAQKWVIENHQAWFGKKNTKKQFWAICESLPNSGECWLVKLLTFDGK